MKYIDADLLKAEIERRNGYISVTHFAEELLAFLDSLPEQPAEGLEDEYKDYVDNDPVYSKLVNRNAGLGIARHFAKWGEKNEYKAIMKKAASDLVDAVERYVNPQKGQFCHRSELLIIKDKLKNLINN